jgi:putative spermidine/putrescine transport system permease protein
MTEEAARVFGANSLRTFWFVTLPALRPGIVAGVIFGFIISFDMSRSRSSSLMQRRTHCPEPHELHRIQSRPIRRRRIDPFDRMALLAAIVLERLAGLRRTLGA